jgi:rhodanese-related sulfurtransferase
VIDVDLSTDYDRGHVPGSTWASRDWLEADVAALTGPQRGVTLVCRHAGAVHARLAAAALLAAGWTELSGFSLGDVADLTTDDPAYARSPMDVRLAPHEQGRQAMLDYLNWEISLHD